MTKHRSAALRQTFAFDNDGQQLEPHDEPYVDYESGGGADLMVTVENPNAPIQCCGRTFDTDSARVPPAQPPPMQRAS